MQAYLDATKRPDEHYRVVAEEFEEKAAGAGSTESEQRKGNVTHDHDPVAKRLTPRFLSRFVDVRYSESTQEPGAARLFGALDHQAG